MTNSPQHHNSLGFFNRVRGLATIWIILGHSIALFITGNSGFVTIPLFDNAGRVFGGAIMAMFLMVSGYYFYRRSPSKCLTTQAKFLLKPYAITGLSLILMNVIVLVLRGGKPLSYLIGMTLTYVLGIRSANGKYLLGIPLYSISILWFLLALFTGWVLYNLILGMKNRKVQWFCIVICMLASLAMSKVTEVWPFVLPSGLMAVGYLAVGHMMRVHQLLERKLPVYCWLIIGIIASISLTFGYIDIARGIWKLGMIDVLGSICVSFLLLRLNNVLAEFQWKGLVWRTIELVGSNSLWVFCLHAFEKEVVRWNKLSLLLPDLPVLCMIVCFVGRCAVMYLLYIGFIQIRKLYNSMYRSKFVITEE